MVRDHRYDVTIDGVGFLLTDDGLGVQKVQSNPYAVKSSQGERSYADLDEWAVHQVDTMHRGMGSILYGDPEEFHTGVNLDTRFKNKVFLGPNSHYLTITAGKTGAVHFAAFGNQIFMSIDREIYQLVGTTWTLRETTTATVTDMCEFNGYLYVAQGTANTMRKTANGTAWTDVGGTPAAYRLYVHGGYLYRSINQVIYYSSDPDAASPTWSSAIYVGDSQYVVQSMITFGDALLVFKNDGGYKIPGNPGEIDKAYDVGELKWRAAIDTANGLACCVWSDGFLYVTHGKGGLLRWTGKTVSSVGLDLLETAAIGGKYWALMPTADFLYAMVGRENVAGAWLVAWNGSGWHCIAHSGDYARGAYYFDPGGIYGGNIYTAYYQATPTPTTIPHYYYLPGEIIDPTEGSGDSTYQWLAAPSLYAYLYTPRFTANLHDACKDFHELIFWAENFGTAGAGTQKIRFDYRVDNATAAAWTNLITQTIAVAGYTQVYKVDFPKATFADKRASVSGTTITLTQGTTADMAAGDWCFFVDNYEYRQCISITDATHFEINAPFDVDITANTYMRPGYPWGRWIQFRISFESTVNTRTPVLKAWALKYLVNVKDKDMWLLDVYISRTREFRNTNLDRQTPISAQLARLNEARKKGRVTFVDTLGESHVVKVTNYSIRPVSQDTDLPYPEADYVARVTLLEV